MTAQALRATSKMTNTVPGQPMEANSKHPNPSELQTKALAVAALELWNGGVLVASRNMPACDRVTSEQWVSDARVMQREGGESTDTPTPGMASDSAHGGQEAAQGGPSLGPPFPRWGNGATTLRGDPLCAP